MMPKTDKTRIWVRAVLAVILLGGSVWSFNVATYNWFAADFHTEFSHAYAARGNVFSLVALALFAGFVLAIVGILRLRKKRRVAKA